MTVRFTAGDSYLVTPSISTLVSLTEATVGFWLYIPSSATWSGSPNIIRIVNTFEFAKTTTANQFRFRWRALNAGNSALITMNITLSTDTWHFVVGRYAPGDCDVFVDSGASPVVTSSTASDTLNNAAGLFQLGSTIGLGLSTGYTEHNGFFAINKKLSNEEILNIYNGSSVPPDFNSTDQVLCIPFDGTDTGDTVSLDDSSLDDIGSTNVEFTSFGGTAGAGTVVYVNSASNHDWRRVLVDETENGTSSLIRIGNSRVNMFFDGEKYKYDFTVSSNFNNQSSIKFVLNGIPLTLYEDENRNKAIAIYNCSSLASESSETYVYNGLKFGIDTDGFNRYLKASLSDEVNATVSSHTVWQGVPISIDENNSLIVKVVTGEIQDRRRLYLGGVPVSALLVNNEWVLGVSDI